MSDNNEGNFDLSGVFHVQDKYLTDMSNSVTYEDINNAPRLAEYVLSLQEKIREARNSYQEADTSADAVLTEQEQVLHIVSEEQKRLNEKAFLIEQAEETERRKALLTESNTLRKAEYTRIILIFIICVAIHIVLLLIVKFFITPPIDPKINTLFILLHIFNFSMWSIFALFIYANIQTRSQINFNKIELPPPNLEATTPSTSPSSNNLLRDLGFCYSDNCCGENTTFDENSGECVADGVLTTPSVESFTTYLDEKPSFLIGSTSDGIVIDPKYGTPLPDPTPPPKPFDLKNSTKEEKKQHFKNEYSNMISTMLPSSDANTQLATTTMPTESIESQIAELQQSGDFDTNNLSKNIKCYFTTMSDSPELNCSKNRAIYQPSSESELLPKNGVLDHTIFYEGINSSENLTNTYSQYN